MNKPKVSVIVPVYNGEKFLEKTLESIRNQEYENFEAIIMDNGSRDGSAAIAKKIAEADSRFVLVENGRNIGYVPNLNKGLSKAEGEYIAFLHADDLWDEKFLSTSVDMLEKNKDAGMSICRFVNIDSAGRRHDIAAINPLGKTQRVVGREELFLHYVERDFSPVCTVLARATVQREIGEYDTQYVGPCDYQMWMKIAYRHPGAYNPNSCSSYRIHESGTGRLYDRGQILLEQYSMINKFFDEYAQKTQEDEEFREKMLFNTAWASLRQGFRAISQNKGGVCRRKCGLAVGIFPSVRVCAVAAGLALASVFSFAIWPLAEYIVRGRMRRG